MGEKTLSYNKKSETKLLNSSLNKSESSLKPSSSTPYDQFIYLQHAIGNKAVGRLLRLPVLQAKLRIGQPEQYEQEAERIPRLAINMPDPKAQIRVKSEEDGKLQKKTTSEQSTLLQRQFHTDIGTADAANSIQPKVFKIGQPIIQRLAFCEPIKECPKRARGERSRAKSNSMIVEKQADSIEGLLVGNFAISSSTIKKDLFSNAEWKSFIMHVATASTPDWEILGFSDCHGSPAFNRSLRQRRAKAVCDALPSQARSKVSGFKGAPLPECMTSNTNEQGRARNRSVLTWRVKISKPAKVPVLKTVKGPFNVNICGRVRGGMDPAKADSIRACISHSGFVNAMHQAVINIKQVATPYAPGLADFYSTMLKKVVKAGQNNPPTPSSPKSFSLNNLSLRISSATTLTVNSITLELVQQGPSAVNGSYSGGVLTLNETSSVAVNSIMLGGDQKEIERVMYHEGLHFISGEISLANRLARRQTPRGALVREELDIELVNTYKPQFEAAVKPFWEEVLKTKSNIPKKDIPKKVGGSTWFQWLKMSNEIITRVEDAIYLAQRAGKGFTMTDLKSLPNSWLFTAENWNPALVSVPDMQAYININRAKIDNKVMPVIREIQKAYLRARPGA